MSNFKLHIDNGHGTDGITAGKRTWASVEDGGCFEGNENRKNGKALANACSNHSVDIVDIVGNAVADISLKNRCKTSNFFYKTGDIFISNHMNAVTGKWQDKARGMRILYVSSEGKKLAQCIADSTGCGIKSAKKKGVWDTVKSLIVKNNHLYVLNKTKATAVLVEWGFFDNKEDLRHVRENRNVMAEHILNGVLQYRKNKLENRNKIVNRILRGVKKL